MIRDNYGYMTPILVTLGIAAVLARRSTSSPIPETPPTGPYLRLVTSICDAGTRQSDSAGPGGRE